MWRIIDWIRSVFCKHDWELIESGIVYDFYDIREQLPLGNRYVYICKNCKKKKIVNTY